MNDMCVALVKELEESTDEEVEMREEKVHYDVKRGMATWREVVVEGQKDEGEGKEESKGVKEEDKDEDEPMRLSRLSVKAKGKQPAK